MDVRSFHTNFFKLKDVVLKIFTNNIHHEKLNLLINKNMDYLSNDDILEEEIK